MDGILILVIGIVGTSAITGVSTSLITCVIIRKYYKNKAVTSQTEGVKNHDPDTTEIKVDTNPAYGTATTIKMDENPAMLLVASYLAS